MAIATGTAIALSVAAASAASSAYAAKKQAATAREAAKLETDAASHAADIQGASSTEALDFTKQQAEADWKNSEITRSANYGQWAAREGRLGSLGQMVGLGARDIPAYVPTQDPNLTGAPTTPNASTGLPGSAPSGAVDGSAASISNYFKSRGVSDQETPYWVSKWGELTARGKEINDPGYAMKRLAAADVFGGQPGAPTPAPPAATQTLPGASPYAPGSIGALTQTAPRPGLSPALQAAQVRYQRGSLGSLAGGY